MQKCLERAQTMDSETLITEGQESNTAEPQAADETTTVDDTDVETTEEASEASQQQPVKEPDSEIKPDEGKKAPEKYEFKSPDDSQQLDDAVISAFSDVARELDMSQDAAQKIVDTLAPALQEQQVEQFTAVRNEWAQSSKNDKEFGGDALDESLATAKKAMDTFGTPELTELLNTSGLGNHPEIIRAFYRAGKVISEDTFVGGQKAEASPKTTAQRMYPGMNP